MAKQNERLISLRDRLIFKISRPFFNIERMARRNDRLILKNRRMAKQIERLISLRDRLIFKISRSSFKNERMASKNDRLATKTGVRAAKTAARSCFSAFSPPGAVSDRGTRYSVSGQG
jgi:hypothetical protein